MNWAGVFCVSTLSGGLPVADEVNYWVDDTNSIVITDEGRLATIPDIIFYWANDAGEDVCDDLGITTSLLNVE